MMNSPFAVFDHGRALPRASTGKDPAVEQSSPRITLAEGDITQNDHLFVELVHGQETPQAVQIHWPVKATIVRPEAYGEAAAKAM